MKIYTKTGDKGKTSLFGGERVQKSNQRIKAYGTIDELNSWIGLLRDQNIDNIHKNQLLQIQNDLFTLGAILATPPSKKIKKNGKERLNISLLSEQHILFLEKSIDEMEATLVPMTHFVLPGGHPTVSFCHISRTVCRRAERCITELYETSTPDEQLLGYINRLSDYLFVLARKLTASLQVEEIKWIPKKL